jgi:hypothetical protein
MIIRSPDRRVKRMPDPSNVQMLKIRTEEKTFKSLADSILNMKVVNESDIANRCALVSSAKTFIEGQLKRDMKSGYRPLEDFLSPSEMAWGTASVRNVKTWLSYNLDVFEKKSSGRLLS